MNVLERMGVFGRRIRGWLPSDPIAADTRGKKAAVSVLAVAVAVFVAAGIAAELVFLPSSSSPTVSRTTSTSTSIYCSGGGPGCVTPTSNVSAAVSRWVADFNARDVTALGNFYSNDALVDWTSSPGVVASGLDGVYSGIGNVRILYGSSIGKTTSLIANMSNFSERAVNPDNVNVSLTLTMKGNSSVVGALAINIDANQQWNYVSGQWQIVKESWNYVSFYESNPVSSTTFPQWTAIKEGHNPDLVSEKSFEWHAGPYVAASVYAFLAGVLGYAVIRYRGRGRSQSG